jgi:carbamoyl-phosphate synthase large subunit
MTGAGAPGAAGIIRCLKKSNELRISGADVNPNALGKYLLNDFHVIPAAGDENFIPALLELCKEQKVDLILPLVTRELLPLSSSIRQFEKINTRVLVSNEAGIDTANDKGRLYETMQAKGLAVPDFRIVRQVSEFKQAVKELGYPEQPVCFKPCVSNGSRGFRILDASVDEFKLLFEQKPDSRYMQLEKALQVLSSAAFPPLVVSELLPGDEYSVDCIAVHGKCLLALPRLRVRTLGGITVEGEFVNHPGIISYCAEIVGLLGLHGNIGIQVKMDKKGDHKILEINPRVQGTIVAALGAGANLPLMAVMMELGEGPEISATPVKWGTKFSRFWDEVYY